MRRVLGGDHGGSVCKCGGAGEGGEGDSEVYVLACLLCLMWISNAIILSIIRLHTLSLFVLIQTILSTHNHDNSNAVEWGRRQQQVRHIADQEEAAMDSWSEGRSHSIQSTVGHPIDRCLVRLLDHCDRYQQVPDCRN